MNIKLLSIVLLAVAVNYACVQSKGKDESNNSDGIISSLISDSGKGEVIEKSYDIDFDELEISTSLNAEVFKSDKEKIVVYAPSDLMKYIVVKQNGGKVQVKIQSEGFKSISTDKIKIKVYAKDFDHLVANSSGSIILKDNFNVSDLDVKVSSSGSIKGNIDGNNINVQVSSSGDYKGEILAKNLNLVSSSSGEIELTGKSNSADVQASSSGEVNAENFTTGSAVLSTSSSGGITIGVSNIVSASSSSSGDINIIKKGNLNNITKNESSSGSVTIR